MAAKLTFKSNTTDLSRYMFDTGLLKSVDGDPVEPRLTATVRGGKTVNFLSLSSEAGTGEIDMSIEEARGLAVLIKELLLAVPEDEG